MDWRGVTVRHILSGPTSGNVRGRHRVRRRHRRTDDRQEALSTPENPSKGVVTGIDEATAKADISVAELELLFHGTTVVTNMLLDETGSRVGLLTTKGHEHVLRLVRAWTPGPLYGWMGMEKPDPLADLVDTRSVCGRIGSPDGTEIEPIDEAEAREAVAEPYEAGVESLTIALVSSYLDPSHERAVRDIAADEYPDLPVPIASEIVSESTEAAWRA
ncbi:hydantoinase/oxoprolinase N-terminal domain-containing protein (plasmid) [Haloferacaceae archaeon DSL9]